MKNQAKSASRKMEAQHSQNNAFVKKQQAALAKYAGRAPKPKADMYMLNETMTNTGDAAQELARKITTGLDKTAFPVK